ncbi:hypothetical protein Stube_18340 [Streptomyces tubercidicus]|uniref:Uncharacterized protein n=1 Tax=Streptomyces tubercidicus TaxID=47759 RepID=A0A640UR25_9ACTN|nr:hypothetical protein Stube_18340 [Streptomyces tubercidicus]
MRGRSPAAVPGGLGALPRPRETAAELSPAPSPSPSPPSGEGAGGGFGGGGEPHPASRTPPAAPRKPRPACPHPQGHPGPSHPRRRTVTATVLNRGSERACIRPWEAAKCDRKINCQWVRLRSEAWVTQTCANSRPR